MITTVTLGYYDGLGTVRAGRFGRTDGTDGRDAPKADFLRSVSFVPGTWELTRC